LRRTATLACLALAAALAGPARAEVTKVLTLRLSGDASRAFAVENLAGVMRVSSGGDSVVATATLHAESAAVADLVRFEQVMGEKGVPTLRVRYPVDRYTTYRYGNQHGGGALERLLGALGASGTKYDGARVRVSGSHGVLLWAEVEVRVPPREIDGWFRNHVGPITANDVKGAVKLDSGSGDVTVRDASGRIVADTGSGNVRASGIHGSFRCDTGSGTCDLSDFDGEEVKCDTGSGPVRLSRVSARRVDADTGSGDVEVMAADVEEFAADTGSGDVRFEASGSRLLRVVASTGSGDVTLGLDAGAGFEARADTGSGDIVSGFADAQAITRRRELVGYRRGDGRIRIEADTGSGDVTIEPRR
jgi:hypothetical protein